MPKTIEFPDVPPWWVFERDCVAFVALVDGNPIRCFITMEALLKYFGARSHYESDCIQAFQEKRNRIQEIARRKIAQDEFTPGPAGELLIKTTDVEPTPSRVIASKISDEIRHDKELERLVSRANWILVELIGDYPHDLNTEWRIPSAGRQDLLQFTILDRAAGVATVFPFTIAQLTDAQFLKEKLYLVFSEFLRARSKSLLRKARASQEVP